MHFQQGFATPPRGSEPVRAQTWDVCVCSVRCIVCVSVFVLSGDELLGTAVLLPLLKCNTDPRRVDVFTNLSQCTFKRKSDEKPAQETK